MLRRVILGAYFMLLVVFLVACLTPLLKPSGWWYFGFLGLVFPYLLLLLLLFLTGWVLARSRWAWLAVIALIIGFRNIGSVFAFHPWSSFSKGKKEADDLRIMTWNVKGFATIMENPTRDDRTEHIAKMFEVIRDYQPDIIAFQEFYSIDEVKWFNNIGYLRDMGYTYYFFPGDFVKYKNNHSGTAIFSKYPMVATSRTHMPQEEGDNVESLLSADIVYNTDTIRMFTAHLQSYQFMPNDYDNFSRIRRDPEKRLDASKSIIRKMRIAFQKRAEQTDIIRSQLDTSPYAEVFCGDLNDVPNSYAYFSVKKDKGDVFLARGFGFGQTFYNFSSKFMSRIPTLRIDFIFTDPRFFIRQSTRIPIILSDHIPVVADLQLEHK